MNKKTYCKRKKSGGYMSKKIAMVIASKNFRDEEYKEPRKALELSGISVTLYSTSLQPSRGMFDSEAKPDKLIDNMNHLEYDGIVFIGGSGASEYYENATAHKLVKEFYNNNKLVAAICIAPKILAKAGILKGKKVCSFPSVKDDIRKLGGDIQPDGVWVDGNIITGTGPEFASDFGNALVKYLKV